MDIWDKCNFEVDPDELKNRVCYAGLDLSSTTDITAFVLVFSEELKMKNTKYYHILAS